jgi:hypothetical protein
MVWQPWFESESYWNLMLLERWGPAQFGLYWSLMVLGLGL